MKAVFVVALMLLAPAALACGSPAGGDTATPAAGDLDSGFATVVALTGKGYEIYWMGAEFEAGGVTWRGPFVARIGSVADRSGLEMYYYAGVGSGVNFFITRPDRCATRRATFDAETRKASYQQSVVAAGLEGTLIEVPFRSRPVNYISAFFEREGTCIEVTAGSVGSATPDGPDGNPALDRSAFLEALANLRPYPE